MKKILFLAFLLVGSILCAGGSYPSVLKHPLDKTVTVGETASFVVISTGASPLQFQWQKTPNTGTYYNIVGATDTVYTIPQTVITDNGSRFRCLVSNPHGRALSNSGILFVNPIISTAPTQTIHVMTDNDLNTVKESVWIDVFQKIAHLDDSYFTGISTGDWTLNASSQTFTWVPVNIDTATGTTCFISTNATHNSWNDNFKLNLINALLDQAWADVTFPFDSIDNIIDARERGYFR